MQELINRNKRVPGQLDLSKGKVRPAFSPEARRHLREAIKANHARLVEYDPVPPIHSIGSIVVIAVVEGKYAAADDVFEQGLETGNTPDDQTVTLE